MQKILSQLFIRNYSTFKAFSRKQPKDEENFLFQFHKREILRQKTFFLSLYDAHLCSFYTFSHKAFITQQQLYTATT